MTDKQEILDELTDMFYDVQPDEEYLEDDEDTAEELKNVEDILQNGSLPIERKISTLASFNSNWFPDGLTEKEQKSYRSLLDAANKINI
jgi:hypothetical protein